MDYKICLDNLLRLFQICKLINPSICFKVRDSEQYLGRFNDPEGVVEEMDGGDEEFAVTCVDPISKTVLGTFFIFLGVEEWEELVNDYTDNEFCETVMKQYYNNEEN